MICNFKSLNMNHCSLWASLLEFWLEVLQLDDEWRHEDVGADVGGLSRLLTAQVHRHLTWSKTHHLVTAVTVQNTLQQFHVHCATLSADVHVHVRVHTSRKIVYCSQINIVQPEKFVSNTNHLVLTELPIHSSSTLHNHAKMCTCILNTFGLVARNFRTWKMTPSRGVVHPDSQLLRNNGKHQICSLTGCYPHSLEAD